MVTPVKLKKELYLKNGIVAIYDWILELDCGWE